MFTPRSLLMLTPLICGWQLPVEETSSVCTAGHIAGRRLMGTEDSAYMWTSVSWTVPEIMDAAAVDDP